MPWLQPRLVQVGLGAPSWRRFLHYQRTRLILEGILEALDTQLVPSASHFMVYPDTSKLRSCPMRTSGEACRAIKSKGLEASFSQIEGHIRRSVQTRRLRKRTPRTPTGKLERGNPEHCAGFRYFNQTSGDLCLFVKMGQEMWAWPENACSLADLRPALSIVR